jgi:hypothetical protein
MPLVTEQPPCRTPTVSALQAIRVQVSLQPDQADTIIYSSRR